MPKGKADGGQILPVRYQVPELQASRRLWQRLAGEIVTANVFRYANESAGEFASGVWLGNKNAGNSEWQL